MLLALLKMFNERHMKCRRLKSSFITVDSHWAYHKVHIYLEYHSVCPLVRIGTRPPTPLPQASVYHLLVHHWCVPHPGTKGGDNRLRGGGVPIRTTGEKALHSVYSVGHKIKYNLIRFSEI
jgi:hypothetical protein